MTGSRRRANTSAGRWRAVRKKLEANRPFLARGGVLVEKRVRGGMVWVVRFLAPGPLGTPVHRSIYVGRDLGLVRRVRGWLADLREPARLAGELAMLARLVVATRAATARVTKAGRTRRATPGG